MSRLFVPVFYQDADGEKKDILLPIEDIDRFGVENVFNWKTGLEWSKSVLMYEENVVVNSKHYICRYIIDNWGRYKEIKEHEV